MTEPEPDQPGIYRSEQMTLAQLFLQSEAAYQCVAELGELGLVQFRDLNPDTSAFQRKYVNEVRRCDEMERKLSGYEIIKFTRRSLDDARSGYLEREIKKDQIPMLDTGENPDAPQPREMIDLEATFEKLENELREVNRNEETLKKNFSELTELKHILRKTQTFFEEEGRQEWICYLECGDLASELYMTRVVEHDRRRMGEPTRRRTLSAEQEPLIITAEEEPPSGPGLSMTMLRLGTHKKKLQVCFVAGVIRRERLPAFERLLWRACRGNVFLRTSEIDDVLNDTVTGEPVNKTVFIIFFQGDQLKTKVKKICEGFRATLYPCPDTPQERREMSIGVMTRIEDLKTVLGQTQDHRHRVLVAASKNVRMWLTKVRKIKSIYHTLNLFNIDVTHKCLIAECWCPVSELDRIKLALKRGTEESGSQVPSILNRMETSEPPPTYHKTNKFTKGFQNIVDAYGIATYREINPAPYTMISFPFLFAVMFGDLGHGTVMLLAALFFILKEKQLEAARIKDEIFQTFFGGRYVIFLMGAFSIYTGLLYNDVFSKSLNIFGSGWTNCYDIKEIDRLQYGPEKTLMLIPEKAYDDAAGPYPIGVDPVWNLAESNKLNFLNSLKMKLSVILGIAQMTFGVLLSYQNHKYFKSDLDIKFMFIPQMVFLACIFIYLCLEIVVKWIWFTAGPQDSIFGYKYPGSNCAPSLLIGLINMFMMKTMGTGFVDDDGSQKFQCYLNNWYPGQGFFQTLFVLTAIVCVPVMLFAKPYLLWKADKERRESGHRQLSVRADMNGDDAEVVHAEPKPSTSSSGGGGAHGHDSGPFEFGEVMVYQAIHTIEFVLGCVSHTASYLRLWALSLAHAQLSDVLWTMVFRHSFTLDGYYGAVATYILFFIFGSLSFFILVLMEGLSAFLHALRLHWVEFQSKFYGGLGHMFVPFSFETILEEEREAEESL
ncbi:V-type ATPase subunit family protein [Oesophagostomum dentatum]|uniref:V-type proton ATPase subunit a n=1 Tax=Oesophagostomum dentatum TaxID=61180 RepID=A0A0B1TPR7_OESDE|nr:V-type ATPase subunit family protein [Oesophagostomum dentatum]